MHLVATLATILVSAPVGVPVQGALRTGAVAPVDGPYDLTITLWDAAEGGQSLWSNAYEGVDVVSGVFHLVAEFPDAALLAPSVWVGISVEGEPELPRQPLGAVPYARVATLAEGLSCSGCVTTSALAPDVSALIEDLASNGGVVMADLLPPDGLDEVSGGLISNTFDDLFSSLDTPKAIADQNPIGVTSVITVPDVGIAQAFSVRVKVSDHSDISELTVTLTAPGGQSIVLFEKENAGSTGFDRTLPTPFAPISGDLEQFVGTNVQGDWTLTVVDDTFDTNGDDGLLDLWSISTTTLSNKKLQVTGDLYGNGNQVKDIGTPTEDTDAANKAYVDASFQDRVFTGSFEQVATGSVVSVEHGGNTDFVVAQAWFKDPTTGLWSETGASLDAEELGDGADGDLLIETSTSLAGGVYSYSSVTIAEGAVVTVTGTEPLIIRSLGPVTIAGTVDLSGGDGTTITTSGQNASGGAGTAGGGKGGGSVYGGSGQNGQGNGAGGAGGTTSYGGGGGGGGHAVSGGGGQVANCDSAGGGGSAGSGYVSLEAEVLVGGSGGGGGGYGSAANSAGGGGGGGGGALKIVAPQILITGTINANGGKGGNVTNNRDGGGGGGGSGGSIWLIGGAVDLSQGQVSAVGGAGGVVSKDSCHGGDGGAGSDGRVRIEAFNINGFTDPPALTTSSVSVAGTPLRLYQPDPNHVEVQNLSFLPLDVKVVVIVP